MLLRKNAQFLMILLVFSTLFIATNTPQIYAAKSVNEIEAEIEKLKEENAAAQEAERISIENVKNIEGQLAETQAKIEETRNELASKEIQISEKQNEIAKTLAEIERIQLVLPEKKEEAGKMLTLLQETSNSQFILKILTDSSENGFSDMLRSIFSLNKITKIASDKIDELVKLEQELQAQKEQLEIQNAELEYERVQLEEKQIALSVEEENFVTLKKAQMAGAAQAASDAEEAQQMIESNEQTLSFYKSQGCSGNQQFGVDCGPEGAQLSSGQFRRPMVNGIVTCEYECYYGATGEPHVGIDISSSNSAEPIYPVADGYVTSVQYGYGGGFGNNVMIRHQLADGSVVFTHYSHMSSINVSAGQSVTSDTQIGNMGNTGNSTGPHLHLEIIVDSNGDGLPQIRPGYGETVNARNYISFPPEGSFWYGER